MAKDTRVKQDKQVRNSGTYDDARTQGAGMESGQVNLENDLNNMRTQLREIIDPLGNWFDDPTTSLSELLDLTDRNFNQALLGPINGTNLVFATATKFDRDGTRNEKFYYNGQLLEEGSGNDYVASEAMPTTGFDTLTLAFPPKSGDTLKIDFTPK